MRSVIGCVIIVTIAAGFHVGWITGAASAGSTTITTATIIPPAEVTNTSQLSFASITPNPTDPGIAVVAPDGSMTCGSSLTCSGTAAPAGFAVAGAPLNSFTLTLPSEARTITGGADSMIVDGFTSDLGSTGVLSNDGQAIINVGATLHVGANQPLGTYTGSITFNIDYQ